MKKSESSASTGKLPTSIAREGDTAIVIGWDDGSTTHWTASQLRAACPCATCREKGREKETEPATAPTLPVLSAAEARPIRIESMNPVGSYAYSIAFSDGHSSGLFPMQLLASEHPESGS